MSRAIEQNESLHRFEWTEEGTLSVLEYRLEGSTLTLTHTEVPEAMGGKGIAGDLVKHALELARRNDWKVRPACSYVAAYIRRHPQYQDLLA